MEHITFISEMSQQFVCDVGQLIRLMEKAADLRRAKEKQDPLPISRHKAGIEQIMSRRGNACDNAPIESFFSQLKNERIHHRQYRTRDEAQRDIFEYIEVFHNRQPERSALGYRSPLEFEALHVAP